MLDDISLVAIKLQICSISALVALRIHLDFLGEVFASANVALVELDSDGGRDLLQVDIVTQVEIVAEVFPDDVKVFRSCDEVKSLQEPVCFCVQLLLLPRTTGIVFRDFDVEVIFARESSDQVLWLSPHKNQQ